jgi:hypothetical protein
MLVSELIAKLQDCPENTEVKALFISEAGNIKGVFKIGNLFMDWEMEQPTIVLTPLKPIPRAR